MCAALAPVFYLSKMGSEGQLNLKSIAGEINWGEALDLIKYEGFYMFGGKNEHGETLDSLYVIDVKENRQNGHVEFSIFKPKMKGKVPPARHGHTLDYVPRLGIVVIYGGRDDSNAAAPILSDIWIITLHNMEYREVQVGGHVLPIPRCSHASYINGTQLIISGGLGEGFKYLKDIQKIELDQSLVNKENPILNRLGGHVLEHQEEIKAAQK
jgi:hypothetical protein